MMIALTVRRRRKERLKSAKREPRIALKKTLDLKRNLTHLNHLFQYM